MLIFFRGLIEVNVLLKNLQFFINTKTCAGTTTQLPHQFVINSAGSILPTMKVRLVDWVEGSYRCTDRPYPRGEIYAGGENIVLGYYNNEKLTSEDFKVFNGVRYFATGDIGEMVNGDLRIIDRKKDLVKLSGGEFVSLNKGEFNLDFGLFCLRNLLTQKISNIFL